MHEGSPSGSNPLPKTPSPDTITLGIRSQHMNLCGHKHSVYSNGKFPKSRDVICLSLPLFLSFPFRHPLQSNRNKKQSSKWGLTWPQVRTLTNTSKCGTRGPSTEASLNLSPLPSALRPLLPPLLPLPPHLFLPPSHFPSSSLSLSQIHQPLISSLDTHFLFSSQ